MLALACLLLLGAGCGAPQATAAPQPAGEEGAATGRVALPAAEAAEVWLPWPAMVELRVHPGQAVRQGEVVAVLRFPDTATRLQQAERAVRRAEAEYRERASRYSSRIETARRWEQEARRAAPLQAAPSRAEVGAVAGLSLRQAASQNLVQARRQVAEAREYVDALLLPDRRKVQQARALLREATERPGTGLALRAPLSGRVSAVVQARGLTSGPLLTVSRPPQVTVRTPVPPRWAGRLAAGAEVRVEVAEGRLVPGILLEVETRPVWRGEPATGQVRGARGEATPPVAVVGLSPRSAHQVEPGQAVRVHFPLRPGGNEPSLQALAWR